VPTRSAAGWQQLIDQGLDFVNFTAKASEQLKTLMESLQTWRWRACVVYPHTARA